MRYRIREIGVSSAARIGFVLGAIVSALPALFDTLILAWVAGKLHTILVQLSKVNLIPEGQAEIARKLGLEGLLEFTLTEKSAELQGLLRSLETLTGASGWLVYVLIFVGGILLTGLLCAALGALAAWTYNALSDWTKGLEVTLEQAAAAIPGAAPQRAAPQPAPSSQGQPVAPPPVQSSVQPSPAPAAYIPVQPAAPRPAAGLPAQPAPAAAGVGPRLALVSDPTKIWPITAPVFAVGSAPGNHLYSTGLSPQHAEIRYDPGLNAHILYDLSGGQAWVNNRPVQKVNKLNNGFRIRLGSLEFIFRS